ncbi:hypothetical protein [Quadrisphaera sp. INWT6]|uniref:hypothetical protein n=1 Tax=Quadrisphaera sp. INWT6 TaxID=2596917 RepID=UPI001892886D|nr:hypothetical protein [Quadrisphaera sp. INWT6]MBF5082516.1 hypothetical protein [Quadrisphaera sp. INWT6]
MERTGLDPAVLAALDAVDAACTWGSRRPATAPTTRALQHLTRRSPASADDGYALLGRLGAAWQTREPLLVCDGNWGSPDDDPADPEHTRVGLSPLGRLALDAERGTCGPVPLGLALGDAGSLDRRVPGFGTAAVLAALDGPASTPVLPAPELATGGTVDVDLAALLAGEEVTARLGCRTHREPGDPDAPAWPPPPPPLPPELQARVDAGEQISYAFVTHAPESFPGPSLVVTGLPPGTGSSTLAWDLTGSRRSERAEPAAPPAVVDVTDRTSTDVGTRVVIATGDASAAVDDLDDVEVWLHAHPASHRLVTWQLPRPAVVELAAWAERTGADPSGLERLRALVSA